MYNWIFFKIEHKKNLDFIRGFFKLAVPTFPVRLQTSIIGVVDLTSVFEMGTGMSPQLYPPEISIVYALHIR